MHGLGELRSAVNDRLRAYLEAKRDQARRLTPESVELVDSVGELTLRGGKRLRPALIFAAYRAVAEGPDALPPEVLDTCAAVEFMQSYLLIHDDWMDHDEERRGGPAVHAALRDAHEGDVHLGNSLAILAGNLASVFAWELITGHDATEVTAPASRRVIEVFLRMHQEVVYGQQLDLVETPNVSLMQQLKTGSYTVRGPLSLGAALADATPAQESALLEYGRPLGEAFQMRDDLLGTFGDRSATGKPTGGDLRQGKRTAIVRAAERLGSEAQLAPLRRVLGVPTASDEALAEARNALVETGAKAAVEARLAALVDASVSALDRSELRPQGVALLQELAERLGKRDR